MNTVLTSPRGLVASALIAIGVCLTLVSCGDTKDPKRLLQLKLYPKDAFILYIDGENEIFIGDITENLGGPFEVTYRWDVLSVDPEGNIDCNVSVKSAVYPMFLSPLGPALENSTFKVRIAPDGEILGFDGTDEMRENVIENLKIPWLKKSEGVSDEEHDAAIADTKQLVISHLSDEALRGLFEPLFRVWPTIPVAPGDRWTLERIPTYLPVPNGGSFATTEFEVTSWEEGEVTLRMQGILQTLDTDEANKLSGSAHGTIILDAIGGFLKSASLNREVKGSVTLQSGDQKSVSAITFHEEVFIEILRL